MEQKIAVIRYKMVTVISLIAVLATWQHKFVIDGVASHIEMNLTILGTFAFSILLSFIFVSKLKNEVIAFQALREMWDDIQTERSQQALDPLWKHVRCTRPAKVFRRPRLLGHAYELVTDEVARTKRITVSVETMNTLVNSIEQSIHDEKSMIVYLSGLLVFMGLIGTFIGLLHMVGSIGGIIGSLAQSSGGAGAAGAFQELLGALQEPLKGMASGFASSLFGLFSSLVVGLLGRFAGQAAGVLKREFEAWLAGLVKIGGGETVNVQDRTSAPAANDQVLVRMVGGILADYGRLAGTFERVSENIGDLRAHAKIQAQSFAELESLCRLQTSVLQEMQQDRMSAGAHSATLAAMLGQTMQQLDRHHAEMRDVVSDVGRSQGAGLRMLAAQQQASTGQILARVEDVSAGMDACVRTPALHALQAETAHGLASLSHLVKASADQQASTRAAVESASERLTRELHAMRQQAPAAAHSDDSRVESALDELNRTVSIAFSAYSSLLQVSLAALEKTKDTAPVDESVESATRPTRAAGF